MAQHEPRMVVEGKPALGRRYTPRGTLEERLANLVLQLCQLLTECRLCYEEATGRLGEASTLYDLGEIAELAKIHSAFSVECSRGYTSCLWPATENAISHAGA